MGKMSEFSQLQRVWQRLDADGDGILTPEDIFRSLRISGLGGVSRQEASDMLWEVSLSPEPRLTFEGFIAAYARAKHDTSKAHEPRRLYNYIVYTLIDLDLNGAVSSDELYQYAFVCAEPGVMQGGAGLEFARDDPVTTGLFVRCMQSGALPAWSASAPSKTRSKERPARPASAPSHPRLKMASMHSAATRRLGKKSETSTSMGQESHASVVKSVGRAA